jgi:hypothetical protein
MCQALGALIAGEASHFAAASVSPAQRRKAAAGSPEGYSNAFFTAEAQSNSGSSTAKKRAQPPTPRRATIGFRRRLR